MSSINPINVNSQSVGGSFGYKAKAKAEEKEAKKQEAPQIANEKPSVSADAVLSYMAKSAVAIEAPAVKTLDPTKYVDEASAKRIAGFIAGFEDKVAEGLTAFAKEFPEMSDSAKMVAVLSKIDKEA